MKRPAVSHPEPRDADEARALIRDYFDSPSFAVVGASTDPEKFGYRLMAAYLRHGLVAIPVNPRASIILGQRVFAKLSDIPEPPPSVSIVTLPAITERIVEEAAAVGARTVWLQPGAENPAAIRRAKELGLGVIAGGPCVLIELDAFGD